MRSAATPLGEVIATASVPNGQIKWMGDDLPAGVTGDTLHSVELTGSLTPRESGPHTFGIKGLGAFTLTVDGTTYFDDVQSTDRDDPFVTFFGAPIPRGRAELTAGEPVEVSLTHVVTVPGKAP